MHKWMCIGKVALHVLGHAIALVPSCTQSMVFVTKTRLFKYTENFTSKNENFQINNSDFLHISAQNIDCGYSLCF